MCQLFSKRVPPPVPPHTHTSPVDISDTYLSAVAVPSLERVSRERPRNLRWAGGVAAAVRAGLRCPGPAAPGGGGRLAGGDAAVPTHGRAPPPPRGSAGVPAPAATGGEDAAAAAAAVPTSTATAAAAVSAAKGAREGRPAAAPRRTREGAGREGCERAGESGACVCGAGRARRSVCASEGSGCEPVRVWGAEEEQREPEGRGAGARRLRSPGCALARPPGTSFMPQEP